MANFSMSPVYLRDQKQDGSILAIGELVKRSNAWGRTRSTAWVVDGIVTSVYANNELQICVWWLAQNPAGALSLPWVDGDTLYQNTTTPHLIATTGNVSVGKKYAGTMGDGYNEGLLFEVWANLYTSIQLPVTNQNIPLTLWFSQTAPILNYTYTNNTWLKQKVRFFISSELYRKINAIASSVYFSHWLQFTIVSWINDLQYDFNNWRSTNTFNFLSSNSGLDFNDWSHKLQISGTIPVWWNIQIQVVAFWQHTSWLSPVATDHSLNFPNAWIIFETIL